MQRTLVVLAAALFLVVLPSVGASPGLPTVPLSEACDVASDEEGILGLCNAVQHQYDGHAAWLNDSMSSIAEQPGVFVVDTLEARCSGGQAGNPDCRLMGGRPVTLGQLALCESSGNPTLRSATATLDAAIDAATTSLFAGTPLEGERICEEHWSTARALVTLP